ncbi:MULTISPECIES: efflux RND transporter permease subunit [unclassified Mesorhizobium]|uniref:efflux RND transporter permease subunit n=1 Tax=unclassified Mesorhizobium TaxID=325217 RepID=UPI0006F46399|nr:MULTISPECIES: efflux RND transporter permease subunit [unclassified Mesorhizobium]KQZ14789.1 acriflavin resistance protein [Mesorhizobium sp. Root1471]KQZ37296.1 acriflavin resistance protein [Mesorhizobium sp. Root554]MDR7034194.1 multidrug efflux pump [Mesorhizobium sp. BE184]
MDIVKLAINNARLTLSVLVFLIIAGAVAYKSVPKEAEPDVAIPIMYVSLVYQGISPEDAERLLLRPVESQLKSLKGLKEMKSNAYQGGANVIVEFDPSIDLGDALIDTRNKVQDAKRDLPSGVEEPTVNEVNLSEFPVIFISLSGDMPERALTTAAKTLRDRIEEVPGVLEGEIQGSRDELVEAIIDPMRLASYGLRLDQMIQGIGQSNSLVAAGAIEGAEGKYAVKVPALIETPEDVANLPVVAGPNAVVKVRDLATVRSTFKDAETISRIDGKTAITIAVKKRIGANVVETIEGAKKVAEEFVAQNKATLPDLKLTYTQDKSTFVNQLLNDLQNHVMIAVILVFIVILYALSGRASLLIGLAIPSSFLMGILLLALMGYTINMIVLFSLILAVGMLVDDAIIVTEYAERRMAEGMNKVQAFEEAAKRMAGPVIAATLTRIAAFSPLLFWPGIVGDFMKYLPITLIVTLAASMAYALIFAPSIGAIIGKAPKHEEKHRDGLYMGIVKKAVHFPITAVVLTIALLGGGMFAYVKFGNGVEFFPAVEPDYGLLYVHARGNLSLKEMDTATTIAEQRMLGWPGLKSVLTKVGKTRGGQDIPEDVIGVINYEFVDWRQRKPAHAILDDLRKAMAGIPGVDVEVRVPDAGPPTGKAIQVELSATDPTGLNDYAKKVAGAVAKVPGVIDMTDGLPPPGVDWNLVVDRAKAAQYNVSPTAVGTVVQLVTTGLKLTDYRPPGADDAVDIRLRLPEDRRTLSSLDELRVETAEGSVPISNFVTRSPEQTVGILNRIDGKRTITIQANVASGFQVAEVQAAVTKVVGEMAQPGIDWKLAGSNEDSAEAGAFLAKAFGAAMFLICIVLLAQFNKFTSVFLVLTCVVMAIVGALLGMLLTGQTFVIVMSGIGFIALAGVVVNNNIVLIDTYDRLREEGWDKLEAVLQTCRERARPVVLTALSAILGVLPIAFGLGLEIFHRETTINAPSTQWWIALSSAIVFGLSFATVLTLIVTPSMLMIFTRSNDSKVHAFFRRLFKRGKGKVSSEAEPQLSTETDVAYPKAAE